MGESTDLASKTPDEELADRIVTAIGAAGLVVAGKLGSLKERLAIRGLTSGDWKVLLEVGHPGAEGADKK